MAACCYPHVLDIELERARALHEQILGTLKAQRTTEVALARLLRTMADKRLFVPFGYASIRDYASNELDLEPRRTRDLLLLGRRLPDLPKVEAALESGDLSWTKAREIARVAAPETETAWLERAGQVSSRVLEHEVAQAVRGEQPPEGEPEVPLGRARRRVVFEMESEEADLLRAALAGVRSRAGGEIAELGDGAILADLARRVLLADDGTAASAERYTVLVQHCPGCRQTTGQNAEIRDTLVAEADCDAVRIDLRPGPNEGRRTRAIPPRVRRVVLARDGHRCIVPGCTNRLWLDIHHLRHFANGGDHNPQNLITLCSAHHRLHHEGRLAVETAGPRRVRIGYADGRVFVVALGASRRSVEVAGRASRRSSTGAVDTGPSALDGDGVRERACLHDRVFPVADSPRDACGPCGRVSADPVSDQSGERMSAPFGATAVGAPAVATGDRGAAESGVAPGALAVSPRDPRGAYGDDGAAMRAPVDARAVRREGGARNGAEFIGSGEARRAPADSPPDPRGAWRVDGAAR